MDTALPQKFPFILDRNLSKADCTENGLNSALAEFNLHKSSARLAPAQVCCCQINSIHAIGKKTAPELSYTNTCFNDVSEHCYKFD